MLMNRDLLRLALAIQEVLNNNPGTLFSVRLQYLAACPTRLSELLQ